MGVALIAATAWAPAAAAPAETPADEVIATIDGEVEVTAGDLRYCYGRAAAGEKDPRELLRNLLDGKIIEAEAAAAGLLADAGVATELSAYRRGLLRDYMWRRIDDDIEINDDEVAAFYRLSRKRRMYSFIKTDDRGRAEEAYAALKAGRPWEEVVAEYSIFDGYAGPGGKWEVPMDYAGDEASEALFNIALGEYTPVVVGADGLFWYIYRADKIVHGLGDESLEKARPGIEATLRNVKRERRFRELVAEVRRSAPPRREEVLWHDILTLPLSTLYERRYGRALVISDCGGVAVYFDDLYAVFEKMFGAAPEIEEIREKRPARYEFLWSRLLGDLEDEALLEYAAAAEEVDRTPAFGRAMAARRGALLVDKFYETAFLPTVAEPTADEIEAYYETHKADFVIPERVEVYLVAMPDRGELTAFYNEVRAGADLVVTGEARNRARTLAEQQLYELPPPRPPEDQEWLGVVAITPSPAAAANERPFVAELRPRVFPFAGLNVLSAVFRLADGRWAFYEPIYYQPGRQRTLDEAEVAYFCRKGVFTQRLASPEVEAAAASWLASLRARHNVVINEAAFARVAESLAAAAAEN